LCGSSRDQYKNGFLLHARAFAAGMLVDGFINHWNGTSPGSILSAILFSLGVFLTGFLREKTSRMEIPAPLIRRTGSAFTIAICIIAFAHGEQTSTNASFTTVPFEPR
jgi:hypothetical protein